MNNIKTISIEIVRPVYLSAGLKQPGDRLELPDAVGRELIAMGKAKAAAQQSATEEQGPEQDEAPAEEQGREQDEAPAERKGGKRA